MNKTQVRLFALAAEVAGCSELEVTLDDAATVADLRQALRDCCPALADVLNHSTIAIDEEYATNEAIVPRHAKLACIPPVSGG